MRARALSAARRALVLGAVLGLGASGCQKRRAPVELEVPAPPPTTPPVPVDRALPGELAEGTDRAFGLPLPRVMSVRARFDDVVVGLADVSPDRVANYVRSRVLAHTIQTGPHKTVFSECTLRSPPPPPAGSAAAGSGGSAPAVLTIEVIGHGASTELHVRNLPTSAPPPGETEADRWRAAGFNPDGTLRDPKNLH